MIGSHAMQIVVGVDGSPSAQHAVTWAAGAAHATASELLLVTVAAPGAEATACEQRLLAEWSRPAQDARVPFRTEVLFGDPRLELLEVASHAGAPLVVVGGGHGRWFPALHLGSTSHYLAQHADRPVAVVPEQDRFDAAHVVVGIDGSLGSAAAVRWAGWVAHAGGGDVTAVHAWQRSPLRVCHATRGANSEDEALRLCRGWTGDLEAAGVLGDAVAIEAEPVDALLKAVASTGAGMLVLGTRGAGGFPSLRLGSVSLRALQGHARPDRPRTKLALRPGWPSMFRAYLHDDAAYRACFAGGWYLTGDIAVRDADGDYWFVGRADDMIKSAGHFIGPFEVERALLAHPAVAEAAAVGKPDPVAGEVVKAFVTLRPGYRRSDDLRRELIGWGRTRLGPTVAPREIAFDDDLPHTTSGKIVRRAVREREATP